MPSHHTRALAVGVGETDVCDGRLQRYGQVDTIDKVLARGEKLDVSRGCTCACVSGNYLTLPTLIRPAGLGCKVRRSDCTVEDVLQASEEDQLLLYSHVARPAARPRRQTHPDRPTSRLAVPTVVHARVGSRSLKR